MMGRRHWWLWIFLFTGPALFVLVFGFVLPFFREAPLKRSASEYSTDIEHLRKLCVVPDFVQEAEWQIFSEQNDWEQTDWSLLARLTISDESIQVLDGMLSESASSDCWTGFTTIPGWLGQDGKLFKPMGPDNSHWEFSITAYKANSFYRSPLFNGIVLRPGKNSLILILYTM